MAIFETSTFLTFASLLLAARKLALDPDLGSKGEALIALIDNGRALTNALKDSGLTPLAREIAKAAEQADRITHPGPALDDAKAIFAQVAPRAFADPSIFAQSNLDVATTTDAMVAAILASPAAHDFRSTTLAERYFREVCCLTLSTMLADRAYVDSISPELWRESLKRQGITLEIVKEIKEDTTELLALVRELHTIKTTTIPEDTLIAMARKIRPRVADKEEALRELDRAADLAAEAITRGDQGSNVDEFVDGVLRRLAEMTRQGRLDEAKTEADDAVDRAEAGLLQLLDAAINQHILAADAQGAARQIARKVLLECADALDLFEALRRERKVYYERGRDQGLRLDLEIAIALAERCLSAAHGPDQRGAALNDLGTGLAILGERESGTARLEEAVLAFQAAQEEWTPAREPLDWAMTQNNLGAALRILGARESGTARLEEAVVAYRAALEERTRDRAPLDWAMTQNNLGAALDTLGARESGTARLVEAVMAYRAALEEYTRDRAPLSWAATQNNLGTALRTLGERESGTARLEEAVVAYRAALEEQTRDRVPLDWAMTQNNLGNVLRTLGARESGTARLEEAVAAYRAALEEQTRDRVPLDWAMTQNNLGAALCNLGTRESGTARLEEAVVAYRAALEERIRDRVPLDWAMTQNNLGNALMTLGARESGTAPLEQAVMAFCAALEEHTRDRVPLHWANTIGNQGRALRVLAEWTQDLQMAQVALDQLQEAGQVLRAGEHISWAEIFERQIPEAEALVARLSARSN